MSDFKIVSMLNPSVVILSGVTGPAISAGTQSQSTGTVVFSNSNNISFGLSNGTITASIGAGAGQTTQTQPAGNIAGAGFTSTTTAGSNIVATQNSNGLSMGVPAFLTTTAAQTAYVLSNSNNVSFGTSGSTVTATATFNQTVDTNKAGIGYTSATQAGTTVGVTNNTQGLSVAWPPYITTYQAQSTQTQPAGNIAGVGTSLNLTNLTGTLNVGTNGVALSLSAGAGGAADGYNSAQFTNSTANSTMPLVWAGNSNGSGNVTVGLTGSTITMSAPSGGGGGLTNVNVSAGTTSNNLSNVVFANSNNVSFGLNGSTITGSASFSQSVQTQASGNIAGSGFTSASTAGTDIVGTLNSNGLNVGIPKYITTYVAQTTQTQAAGNIAGIGYTSTTQAGSTVGATHNTAGLSVAWPPFITTAPAAQTTQTQPAGNIAGIGTSLNLTNLTGTLAVNSNGVALSMSAAPTVTDSIYSFGFVGPQVTTSIGQSSLYLNYAQLDDALSVCRAEHMISLNIGATTSFTTSVAGGNTLTSTSVANANSWQMTRSYGVYTLGTGASSTQLLLASSNTVSIGGTRGYTASHSINSNSVSNGATNGFSIAAIKNIDSTGGVTYTTLAYSTTASASATSAATISTTTGTTSIAMASTSFHTGAMALPIPWGSTLPGNNFWFGLIQASSSTSAGTNSTVMSISNFVATNNSATQYRHISNTATSAGYAQIPGQGVYSAATGAFPASIGFTQINNNTVFSNGFFPTMLMNITL